MLETLVDDPATGLAWSACLMDAASGARLAAHVPDRVAATASIGKVLLLVELARRFDSGELKRAALVGRGQDPVADSGLWQVMDAATMSLADAARLVGAVSDNLATNVLLDVVGLDAVSDTAALLGLRRTALADRVRDHRLPEHPPALSRGSAAELAALAASLHRGEVLGAAVSEEVTGWLALGTDLSMVGSSFGLDPLAHRDPDRGIALWNKTGTDATVRAEIGVVRTADRAVAYAVLAEWSAPAPESTRDDVLSAMRAVGGALRALVTAVPATG